jgi:VWFA-related protein
MWPQRTRSFNRSLSSLAAAGIVLGVVLLWPATAQQTSDEPSREPPRSTPYVEKTEVELALIEAVVLDSKGRHVRGLSADGFRMLAGGEEVQIVSVDEIDLGAPAARASTPTAEPAPGQADAPTDAPATFELTEEQRTVLQREAARRAVDARLSGQRWFVMIFDGYNNVSPRRMGQVRKAAKQWLDKNMRGNDLAAVYGINPYLISLAGFTNDREHLKESIDDVGVFPASPMGTEMIEQRFEQGGLLTRQALEEQLLNAATFGADLLAAERDQFYMNISVVADVLRSLQGTRAVLLFSGGFPITLSRSTEARGGLTTRFMDMLRALEEEGVRVFTYDIGEDNTYVDAENATSMRSAADELGIADDVLDDMQLGAKVNSATAHREILGILGANTGGRFFPSYDYARGLQAADDDLSHYYLIGYTPPKFDDGDKDIYHRLKLRYEGKGYRIVSRQGRFRTTQPAPVATASITRDLSPDPVPEDESIQPLEVSCRPLFYPTPGGDTLVVLPIRVDGPLEPMQVSATERVIDFDLTLTAAVGDETVETGKRSIRVPIKPDQTTVFQNGMRMRDAMLLPATTVDLTVDVRLNGQARAGRWQATTKIPRRATDGFGLTDLAVFSHVDPTPLVYDVFLKNQNVLGTHPPSEMDDPVKAAGVASPYLTGDFSKGDPLLAQVQVAAPPPPTPEQQRPLSMDWELIPSGGGEPLAPPVQYRQLQMLDDGRMLDVIVDLNLGEVAPGEYTLRLTAVNLLDQSRDVRTLAIKISR